MENKKIITNSEWLDDVTFIVNFAPYPTSENFELKGVTEEVVVEYHKDENKWVVDKQYFDADGGYIDHSLDDFSPIEKAEFLTMAENRYKSFNVNDTWEDIIVADNYEKFDEFVDSIKNYYSSMNGESDEVAIDVENFVTEKIMDILFELDKKYKK